MSSDQASGVVADARTGRPGAEFAVPGGGMVMVVDLDLDLDAGTGSGGGDLRPPAGWPCVVVAISTTPTVPPAAGMDVALTAAVDPPAPWISVSDPAERAAALVSTIERHALASMTLIQVLRAGVALDVDAALVLESLAYATLQAGPEHLTWLRDRQAPPVDARTDPAVRLDRHDDVLDVVLDRPERRNAFSRAMRDDLVAALDVATADPSITEIRLAGAGSNFCSGPYGPRTRSVWPAAAGQHWPDYVPGCRSPYAEPASAQGSSCPLLPVGSSPTPTSAVGSLRSPWG
jgi:hypothetical protein